MTWIFYREAPRWTLYYRRIVQGITEKRKCSRWPGGREKTDLTFMCHTVLNCFLPCLIIAATLCNQGICDSIEAVVSTEFKPTSLPCCVVSCKKVTWFYVRKTSVTIFSYVKLFVSAGIIKGHITCSHCSSCETEVLSESLRFTIHIYKFWV